MVNVDFNHVQYSYPFLVFNRPDTTQVVFNRIREIRPSRLYVAADAPRKGRKDEALRCKEVKAIIEQVDWPCSVRKLYRDKNLGCKRAISSAISWFLNKKNMA